MDELVLKQQVLRGLIERALENFKKVGKNNLTPAKVRSRIKSLITTWQQFQDGHLALSKAAPDEAKLRLNYFIEDHLRLTENSFQSTLDYMSDILEELEPPGSPNTSMLEATIHRPLPSSSSTLLPPIQLPPFNGNYAEWESFRDRFSALVRNNPDLSDYTRMHYLSSSVSGTALECIKHLSVKADNFKIAWEVLVARFENPRRLLSGLLSALLNLPTVTRECASDLNALRDKACVTIASLKNLGRDPATLWTDILVHLVTQRFDPVTRKAWVLKASDPEFEPSFDHLEKFLATRVRAIEELTAVSGKSVSKPPGARINASVATTSPRNSCPLCQGSHFINACSRYLRASPSERRELVRRHNRCFNCLSSKHSVSSCPSSFTCRICHKYHHSTLHADSDLSSNPNRDLSSDQPESASPSQHRATAHPATVQTGTPKSVLLATAWVKVGIPDGRCTAARALIDQGAQLTFISENLAQRLHAPRIHMPTSLWAVTGVPVGQPRHAAHILISPLSQSHPSLSANAIILHKLTAYTPSRSHDVKAFAHLADLSWADEDPTSSDPIDLLIGANLYGDLILEGLRKGAAGELIAQNTIFGWIISGRHPDNNVHSQRTQFREPPPPLPHVGSVHHILGSPTLESELQKFWELEELPPSRFVEPRDAQCENHFLTTHSRDPSGRYVVRLPFKTNPPINIGQSRDIAAKLERCIMRRLQFKPDLLNAYNNFLTEYEQLGHMRPAPPLAVPPHSLCVYIPHHPVLRSGSSPNQIRVVFNASCHTTNGTSLNDHLLTGPKLQADLTAVILRWRQWKFVYSADITKMYRQIRIDARDINYQRILWHANPSSPLQEWQLLTVTYGMACAPFLALRVLEQLSRDDGHLFPLAREVMHSNTYVDDLLFGSNDIDSLRIVREQVISLLNRGGFSLHKWASNSPDLLSDTDVSDHALSCDKPLGEDERLKVLGLGWNPARDVFTFIISPLSKEPATKRSILSVIARLYDPLGWITPMIIKAKILMQGLWRSGVAWDDPVPDPLLKEWSALSSRMNCLSNFTLPRWTGFAPHAQSIQIHGFADASNCAYAAVVFLRIASNSGSISVSLLAAKSRVAPLNSVSVPRLELCAAVLLSRLVRFVIDTLGFEQTPVFCWTDSTVALSWISGHPARWKSFVANRAAKIQSLLPSATWRYVPSADNPADCASRGLLADELIQHSQWWSGPSWLKLDANHWPHDPSNLKSDVSLEEKTSVLQCSTNTDSWPLASRFSSWPKLIRVTAYILRFVRLCRPRLNTPPFESVKQHLTAAECHAARLFWLRRIQSDTFPEELHALSRDKPLASKSPLVSLRPFLDQDRLIRVGGRLNKASLPYNAVHPIVLSSHPLVVLLVAQTHLRALHAGPQLTLSLLRRDFWILRARSIVRHVIRQCVACVRERAAVPSQLMGALPPERVTRSARSFLHCGVDYAGPILVQSSAGRGIKGRKAYIALFICLASKAIHLEVVSDYTTAAFMNAFARFCSRRGLPEAMYSDNGSNFVGANIELTKAYRAALRDPNFLNSTASDNISWHFIPPSAPHFGGLWEAGVRSVKSHLSKVLGDRTLTFEELYTLLCKIEACLNSRPLVPFSDALDDYNCLTPGHFTVGSALTTYPEPSVLDLNVNRLSRWQLVQQMTERFWRLWQHDYINTLQQRSKWQTPKTPVDVGRVVLLRNPSLPPCKWELGRITNCHPGSDGLTRVVTVKTARTEYKRPIGKLCLLPVSSPAAEPPSK